MLRGGLGLFFRKIPSFVALEVLGALPFIAFDWTGLLSWGDPLVGRDVHTGTLMASAIALVLWTWIPAAMVRLGSDTLEGRHATLTRALGAGLRRLPSGVALALLLVLALVGIGTLASAAGGAIGSLFVFAVGGYALTSAFVALPAVVVEKLGAVRALRRSHALGLGNRWRLFGLVFVLWLMLAGPFLLLATTGDLRAVSSDPGDMLMTIYMMAWHVAALAIITVAHARLAALEGATSPDELAGVFE